MEPKVSATIKSPVDTENAIAYFTQFGRVYALPVGDNKAKIYELFIRLNHPHNTAYTVTSEVYEVNRAQLDIPNQDGLNPWDYFTADEKSEILVWVSDKRGWQVKRTQDQLNKCHDIWAIQMADMDRQRGTTPPPMPTRSPAT